MTIGALLLCGCLGLQLPEPPRDRWLGEDKVKHFITSFVATSFAASAARVAGLEVRPSVWVGVGAGVSVGVWKEIRDHGRPEETSSLRDLAWDLLGVGTAGAMMGQVR